MLMVHVYSFLGLFGNVVSDEKLYVGDAEDNFSHNHWFYVKFKFTFQNHFKVY